MLMCYVMEGGSGGSVGSEEVCVRRCGNMELFDGVESVMAGNGDECGRWWS